MVSLGISEITEQEGILLVKIARQAIEKYVQDKGRIIIQEKEIPNKFNEKSGVFVTINLLKNANKELRGCIGFPKPTSPLIEALIEAAISAATEDPRFEPLSSTELDRIIVEVTVLTTPALVVVNSPKEYCSKIKVGEDGLIIYWKYGSGLLLPQVPVEYNWNAEEFLSHACMKAGATPDLWLTKECKIYEFHGIIFGEDAPRGKIKRMKLQ